MAYISPLETTKKKKIEIFFPSFFFLTSGLRFFNTKNQNQPKNNKNEEIMA